MSWFIIALIAPFIWSIINHLDKYLVSKYFHDSGVGALMIFVGLVALPLTAAILYLYPNVLDVATADIWLLIITGILYNVTALLYLYALEDSDASAVVPFWQLAPVFAYIFGIIILGEVLEGKRLFAGVVVVFGALLLSINISGPKITIRKKVAVMMIFSSLAIGLSNVLFKKSAIDNYDFWISMFWNQIGMLIFAVGCFFVTSYRKQFLKTFQQNSKKILSISIFEQIAETVGIIVANYAVLLAPAALIVLIEYSAQPLFVFIFGIILTLLFPKFIKEDISKKNLAIKFISIIIMAIGVYFIYK